MFGSARPSTAPWASLEQGASSGQSSPLLKPTRNPNRSASKPNTPRADRQPGSSWRSSRKKAGLKSKPQTRCCEALTACSTNTSCHSRAYPATKSHQCPIRGLSPKQSGKSCRIIRCTRLQLANFAIVLSSPPTREGRHPSAVRRVDRRTAKCKEPKRRTDISHLCSASHGNHRAIDRRTERSRSKRSRSDAIAITVTLART